MFNGQANNATLFCDTLISLFVQYVKDIALICILYQGVAPKNNQNKINAVSRSDTVYFGRAANAGRRLNYYHTLLRVILKTAWGFKNS